MNQRNSINGPAQPSRDERQWEIDRYLLDDPTLDRDAFELQMLDDVSLAEQVAATVGSLELIELAASSATHQVIHTTVSFKRSFVAVPVWAVLATVASILIAVAFWRNLPNEAADHVAVSFEFGESDRLLPLIAEHWLAFEHPSVVNHDEEEVLSEIANGSRRNELSELELLDQTDWLVEAARQFYQENGQGTQG